MQRPWIHIAQGLTWWLLIGLTIVAIACIVFFRSAAENKQHPIVVDASAPAPSKPIQSVLIFDERTVEQTFVAESEAITDIAFGVRNLNDAPQDATISIALFSDDNNLLKELSVSLNTFWEDDLTIFPFEYVLIPKNTYTLRIATRGIKKGHDASIFFQPSNDRYPAGSLYLEEANERTKLSGNIGFRLLYRPTVQASLTALSHSNLGKGILILLALWLICGVLLLLLLTKPRWQRFVSQCLQSIPITRRKVEWKSIFLALVVGCCSALVVTWPFYQDISTSSVFGDVHRALVYRGVARTSILSYKQMGLWEPYQCGGAPLLANSESAQLDPLFLLTLAFGENLGLRLSVTTMLAIGFIGAYLLAFQFTDAGRGASLLAGAIFSFSGFQMLGFANGAYAWLPIGWIPWILLFYLHGLVHLPYVFLAGLLLSFTFLGGGIHMFAWTSLTLLILGTMLSLTYKQLRPLAIVFLIYATMISVAAIKLVPSTELQATSTFSRPMAFIPPLKWIPKMFIDRTQLNTQPWFYQPANQYFRWYDFGSYIGIVPAVLLIASVLFVRRRPLLQVFLITSGIFLLMTYGFPPWSWLIQNNIAAEILRSPQRARAVLVLFVGMLVADTAERLRLALPANWSRIFIGTTAIIVIVDVISLHRPLFHETFRLPLATLEPAQTFIRQDASFENPGTGHFKASYDTYLSGRGTTDSCLPFMFPYRSNVSGIDTTDPNRPYYGEAYIEGGTTGTVSFQNPNEFSVQLPTAQSGWLIINTNYFPGWQSPGREVVPRDGKIATRVSNQDQTIAFRYNPRSYQIGRGITIIAIGVGIVILVSSYPLYFPSRAAAVSERRSKNFS